MGITITDLLGSFGKPRPGLKNAPQGIRAYVRPAEDAARLREEGVPLFIIHSTADEVVPFEHAELFERAYPDAVFWKIEDLNHAQAYTHPEYRERLLGFLESENLR